MAVRPEPQKPKPYDVSAVIWQQITIAARFKARNPCGGNFGKCTMSKKFVTLHGQADSGRSPSLWCLRRSSFKGNQTAQSRKERGVSVIILGLRERPSPTFSTVYGLRRCGHFFLSFSSRSLNLFKSSVVTLKRPRHSRVLLKEAHWLQLRATRVARNGVSM